MKRPWERNIRFLIGINLKQLSTKGSYILPFGAPITVPTLSGGHYYLIEAGELIIRFSRDVILFFQAPRMLWLLPHQRSENPLRETSVF